MDLILDGYRGLAVIVALNADRLIYLLAIIVGLTGGALIGAELIELRAPAIPVVH